MRGHKNLVEDFIRVLERADDMGLTRVGDVLRGQISDKIPEGYRVIGREHLLDVRRIEILICKRSLDVWVQKSISFSRETLLIDFQVMDISSMGYRGGWSAVLYVVKKGG